MFEFNPFALPPFFSALLIITIGIYVLLRNPRSEKNRTMFYFCLNLFFWLICYTLIYCSNNKETALKCSRYAVNAIIFIPFTFYYSCVTLIQKRNILHIAPLIFITILLNSFCHSPYFYSDVIKYYWGYYPTAGPLYSIFVMYYIFVWTCALKILHNHLKNARKSKDLESYNQIKYVFVAWLGGSLGIVDFLPKYGIPIYPFAYLVAVYWVCVSAFSIMQHHLLEYLYYAARKFLCYSVFSIIVFTIMIIGYFLIETFNSTIFLSNPSSVYFIATLILGLLLHPLYEKISGIIDEAFFNEYKRWEEKLNLLENSILTSKDIADFNKVLLESIYNWLRIQKISFYIWNEKFQVYQCQCLCEWGVSANLVWQDTLNPDHSIPQSLTHNQYLLSERVYSRPNCDQQKKDVISWMANNEAKLCIPIKNRQLMGFLVLGAKESGLGYSSMEISSLNSLASIMSMAIQTDFLKKSHNELTSSLRILEDSSVRDSMTHLYNYKKIKNCLTQLIVRPLANEKIFVLMADIDHFKKINDKYGHPIGDKVIITFANILSRLNIKYKNVESVGRVGGEEFMVIINGGDVGDVKSICEYVLCESECAEIVASNREVVKFTVSLGGAYFYDKALSLDDLVNKADEMLYAAKAAGRNCYRLSDINQDKCKV